ncbi:MAG: riboflavin synthase [Chitinophagales bacterium]|nr:riboflavin synthase [Chitinophagales bacterium]
MFTGIIETIGTVVGIKKDDSNIHFTIEADFTNELQIDQSVAHNGVCLTVVAKKGNTYTVTAIKETLDITNLGQLQIGDIVNLERAMISGARLDGHMVQGHVDQTAKLIKIKEKEGSHEFLFKIKKPKFKLVNKGSICVDGTSLTVVKAKKNTFKVAIIPYTYEYTIFHTYQENSIVNIEFDIIGKYVERLMQHYQ